MGFDTVQALSGNLTPRSVLRKGSDGGHRLTGLGGQSCGQHQRLGLSFLFLKIIFIFGCVSSWLQHLGSFLALCRLFSAVSSLSGCGAWA